MIITRTPLRISLGGGGTDLPSYYRHAGSGFLIAAAITKYIYVAVNRNFYDYILLKYSELERVTTVDDIRHKLIKECLKETGVENAVEISSMADIPSGTGLGSSGSFTVGLLKALYAYKRTTISHRDIAEKACEIEINKLATPSGKQDQYIAAIGGLTAFEFFNNGTVHSTSLELGEYVHHWLAENLMLFYTGIRRSTRVVLSAPETATSNLDDVKRIGYDTLAALTDQSMYRFGQLLTEQWKLKFARANTPTHFIVDDWITEAIDAGAIGAKLVGAGDGGFLLVAAENKASVRRVLAAAGLEEVRFGIDYEGTKTLVAS